MTQPLEASIAATLQARANRVRTIPDLGDRVVARGRRMRRQRRAYGGLAVIVAVAAAVGAPALLADREVDRTPGPPVATPTGLPSPSLPPATDKAVHEVPRPWDDLPLGATTNVPFAVGSQIFAGEDRIALQTSGDPINQVRAVGGDYLVHLGGTDAIPGTVALVGSGRSRKLDRGAISGFAVDADGQSAAWAVQRWKGSTTRTRLTLANLSSGDPVAEYVVDGPWSVLGVADGRVVITFLGDPATSPSVWDPREGTVTKMQLPRSLTHLDVVVLQSGGGLLLLEGYDQSCPIAVLTLRPGVPLWERCDLDPTSGAVSADGSRLAVIDGWKRPAALVLDATTGETTHSWALPRGAAVDQMTWEDAEHVLFAMTDSHQGSALATAVIRCRIGESMCERVPTPKGRHVITLGTT